MRAIFNRPNGTDSRVSSMVDLESDAATLVSAPLDFKNGALYNVRPTESLVELCANLMYGQDGQGLGK